MTSDEWFFPLTYLISFVIRHSSFVTRHSPYGDVGAAFQPGARLHVSEPRLNELAVQAKLRGCSGLFGSCFGEHGTSWIHDEGLHVVARSDQKNMVLDGACPRQQLIAAPDGQQNDLGSLQSK